VLPGRIARQRASVGGGIDPLLSGAEGALFIAEPFESAVPMMTDNPNHPSELEPARVAH
jgi:hypothetical protein